MKFLLAIVLLASVSLAHGARQQVDIEQCLREGEAKFVHLVVPAEVVQLLDVVRAAHPGTEFIEIDEISDEVEAKLEKLAYPNACDRFLKDFEVLNEVPCLNQIQLDAEARQLIGKNKRISGLLGASSVCYLSQDAHAR